jgi:hypothetical protein
MVAHLRSHQWLAVRLSPMLGFVRVPNKFSKALRRNVGASPGDECLLVFNAYLLKRIPLSRLLEPSQHLV